MQDASAPQRVDSGQTLVTIATFNEIENLPRLVDEVFRVAPDVDVLVIDDNSPDGTGAWCDRKAAEDPRVHCLHRPAKLGLGTAIVAGLQWALDRSYSYVLNMDGDFSHHPRYLPALRAGMEPPGAPPVDVMIGSRMIPGGRVEGWPWRRRLMSQGVNRYARLLLGLPVRDCSGSFRCYRIEMLRRLDLDAIRSKGYAFYEEILWHLKRLGARFDETPIVFQDRQRGASKIDAREAFHALRIIFLLGLKNWFGRRANL